MLDTGIATSIATFATACVHSSSSEDMSNIGSTSIRILVTSRWYTGTAFFTGRTGSSTIPSGVSK
jgi:hypothetical protein